MEEARAAAAKAAKEANNPALALRKFLKATQPADPAAVKSIKDEEEDTHAAEKAVVPTDGEGYVNVARASSGQSFQFEYWYLGCHHCCHSVS